MNNFNHNLLSILDDIQKCKRSTNNQFLTKCIEKRLQESINQYYKQLIISYNYLKRKDTKRMIKKMNKLGIYSNEIT